MCGAAKFISGCGHYVKQHTERYKLGVKRGETQPLLATALAYAADDGPCNPLLGPDHGSRNQKPATSMRAVLDVTRICVVL